MMLFSFPFDYGQWAFSGINLSQSRTTNKTHSTIFLWQSPVQSD
jgi:hypothetical protein